MRMVSRKSFTIGLALLLILGALALWLFREPSYQGRTLGEWIEEASSQEPGGNRNSEAVAAIRAIGPDAVPYLARMLSARETRLSGVYRSLRNEWARPENRIPAPWELQRRALVGLHILGPEAAPAVPEIARLIEEDPLGRMELWYLLDKIGPRSASAAPLLEKALPGLGLNEKLGPNWNDGDFHPAWLASDLRMTWGGTHRQKLAEQLLVKTNNLISRVACLWALRKDSAFARELLPSILSIIADEAEPAILRIASLHALGRIPSLDEKLIEQPISKFEMQFGRLSVNDLRNGNFSQTHWTGTNGPPPDPKAPSLLYTNWLTWKGVVGRNLAPAWGNALKIELGPRSPGGAISQTFRTVPGMNYEIRFEAASGRNMRAEIHVGDLAREYIPASNDPAKPTKFIFEFKASSPLTTLTFHAPENEAYGPFIDKVVVEMKKGDNEPNF